ncbi:MAG: UDP-N-acetylglucosamine--N-acetylmuramyl-(pentapeptide) pyrophosphoryl-undecaprenol N-acetylglucosamine transferase [Elusimicrobia bacterium]|nr:UDP-N-acetylglucosamine--N-acetylmuramyl-(pentapeptide) pyrophosphoryl-undecaprenol N-acetylglucosamine transferase [Elusimicrobiota bacterium]
MKILIAAGGTGGHFYPGLAVARELLLRQDSVFFIIKKGDYVRPLLDRENIPYFAISAGGFKRSLHPANILVVLKLIFGFFESLRLLIKIKPNRLLVMGGYLSVPPALAARCLKIPVFLHEQNAIPGLANRCLSWLAAKVAVSFPSSKDVFGKKAVVTGNPIRKEFLSLPNPSDARKRWGLVPGNLTFLVFGGSLGAHRVNQLVIESLEKLTSFVDQFQFIHITGPSDVAWAQSHYKSNGFHAYVDSYCHDMPSAYAASDFVIARAGASTVSEIMVVKKPALFIPYPLATGGHQTANARYLADQGLAVIYEQKNLAGGEFVGILKNLMEFPAQWQSWWGKNPQMEINPAKSASMIADLVRESVA